MCDGESSFGNAATHVLSPGQSTVLGKSMATCRGCKGRGRPEEKGGRKANEEASLEFRKERKGEQVQSAWSATFLRFMATG